MLDPAALPLFQELKHALVGHVDAFCLAEQQYVRCQRQGLLLVLQGIAVA